MSDFGPPRVTGNAQMLLGSVMAAIWLTLSDYETGVTNGEHNTLDVTNRRTGNVYRVTIVQVDGTE